MLKQSLILQMVMVTLLLGGCESKPKAPPPLDLEALLTAVDEAIGKRFQSMQMEGMDSATYMYDGPIDDVLKIVIPIATKSGYSEDEQSEEISDSMKDNQEMQEKMGFQIGELESRTFVHPDGKRLMVMKMEMSGDNPKTEMKMISIQFMDSEKMKPPGEN